MTCWRRLRDWHAAGVPGELHRVLRVLLERLAAADALGWSRASIDEPRPSPQKGADVGAHEDRPDPHGPGPTGHEAARRGRRPRHAAGLRGSSGANRHDSRMLAAVLDVVPGVRRGRGRPRCPRDAARRGSTPTRPTTTASGRTECRERSITPRIARRGVERSDRLGRHRWVVERTLAWLARFRRLTIRDARRADIHWAFTSLACSLVCLNQIRRFC
jgi:transposase